MYFLLRKLYTYGYCIFIKVLAQVQVLQIRCVIENFGAELIVKLGPSLYGNIIILLTYN
jgi:hypothetical protein